MLEASVFSSVKTDVTGLVGDDMSQRMGSTQARPDMVVTEKGLMKILISKTMKYGCAECFIQSMPVHDRKADNKARI